MERFDSQFEPRMKIEAVREKKKRHAGIIKLAIGSVAIGCALYAIYMQF
ncbi:MAG: hypothetical protein LC768_10805 [Acidobacteria bacterium]|nr:hypothetical protein [Acidobacteriota bacterium]MCA1638802.1 hypothetical protein [Acidobacteriota bacterium]